MQSCPGRGALIGHTNIRNTYVLHKAITADTHLCKFLCHHKSIRSQLCVELRQCHLCQDRESHGPVLRLVLHEEMLRGGEDLCTGPWTDKSRFEQNVQNRRFVAVVLWLCMLPEQFHLRYTPQHKP